MRSPGFSWEGGPGDGESSAALSVGGSVASAAPRPICRRQFRQWPPGQSGSNSAPHWEQAFILTPVAYTTETLGTQRSTRNWITGLLAQRPLLAIRFYVVV